MKARNMVLRRFSNNDNNVILIYNVTCVMKQSNARVLRRELFKSPRKIYISLLGIPPRETYNREPSLENLISKKKFPKYTNRIDLQNCLLFTVIN